MASSTAFPTAFNTLCDEFGVPEKIITALPEASWRVVWGSSARVASTVSLQGACSVCVLSASKLEVCSND